MSNLNSGCKSTKNFLQETSKEVRKLIIEALKPKKSHHIGCSLSIVDIVVFLYFVVLNIDPSKPENKERDIFILSKGHAALAVYAVLCKKKFFSKKELMTYDEDGGNLPEHINTKVPGVELSTGSLGHGLPVGLGFATSFINDQKKNKVYVLMSDGELDEGSNWEAIMYAGHHLLKNLVVIVDNNKLQGYSETKKVIDLSPIDKKVASFKWNTYIINGHSFSDLKKVFQKINTQKNNKPNFIVANTIKGKGIPFFEGKFESHYQSLDAKTKKEILSSFDNFQK